MPVGTRDHSSEPAATEGGKVANAADVGLPFISRDRATTETARERTWFASTASAYIARAFLGKIVK